MANDQLNGNIEFNGEVTFRGQVNHKALSITNAAISSTADIDKDKLAHHQFSVKCFQEPGTDVVAQTAVVHVARKAGTIVAVQAAAVTAPAGGDKKTTIDLEVSTGGGAFASVLSAAFDIPNGGDDLTAYSGTISSASYAAGDLIEIVVTVSGSTGTQADGLVVTVTLAEEPN